MKIKFAFITLLALCVPLVSTAAVKKVQPKKVAVAVAPPVLPTEPLIVDPPKVKPAGPYVYVTEGGEEVFSKNSEEQWPIASITKLMTAMVLQDMKLNWKAPVTLARADEVGGARLRVTVGSKYSRTDLLHASLMGSANNATYALARTSGLTVPQFVARMNAKAKSLGMTNSKFADPTGLNLKNVSTAEDVAKMVAAAHAYPMIRDVETKVYYNMQSIAKKPKTHTIKTTDTLLAQGEPVELAKTGYLVESRYNFTMLYRMPNGTSRTIVVFGAPSMASSIKIAHQYATAELAQN